jgi:hypothetical protein
MKNQLKGLAIVWAAGLAATTGTASAEGQAKIVKAAVVEDVGAQERINFSGKLRMLSQRIPSAACHVAAGVDVDGATKLLTGATAEFEKILTGLEFGDADLKIKGQESRRKTLAQIHDLREKWTPVKAAATAMIEGDASPANVDIILGQNMTVLGSAKLLVSELVGQYSDPSAMLQADSILIDIAGRQRMLTQKMSKEACMLQANAGDTETAQALTGTMQMFEVSLMALRNGMPEAGIKAPPNAEISEGLDVVISNWGDVKPSLDAELAGADLSAELTAQRFITLNTTMGNMNKVVGMYTQATKLGL